MGIFDPSFPDIRTLNAERRAAIKDLAERQIEGTPEPTPTATGTDLLTAIDAETGVPYYVTITDVQGTPVDVSDVVRSDDITTIVALTQAAYDLLTPDPATLYVITG